MIQVYTHSLTNEVLMLTVKQQQEAAKAFVERWQHRGDEKQHTSRFWLDLLGNVFGIEQPTEFINFEERVMLGHTSYIDAMIPSTHVMIEQKSSNKSLHTPIKQSDGMMLTPFEQAKRYSQNLPYSERPRWIVSCNFQEFLIFDMERPNDTPESILLQNLGKEYYRLQFLVNVKEDRIQRELEISKHAGELIGRIYEQLYLQYKVNPNLTEDTIHQSINKLCVRLVFCLYAEDAGLFGTKHHFRDYLNEHKPSQVRKALLDLFRILDTPMDERSPYEEQILLDFPYVNGSLFAEVIEIPQFDEATLHILVNDGCQFDWSEISPTIFGGIFESTLNPETRRHGGMHYTSIENIHKVIEPLFLTDLKQKFHHIMSLTSLTNKDRIRRLLDLQTYMASLTFLDPAAGSGNFLTESFLSLRRLENDILRETHIDKFGSALLGFEEINPVKVSIQQFYGIEINDFAVAVARTALWIAEAQMLKETQDIIHRNIDFFPLHTFVNIHEANALQLDWQEVIAPSELHYIMGNPPFLGYGRTSPQQRKDLLSIFTDEKGKQYKGTGKIDYVAAWFYLAAKYIKDTPIQVAFVSTNSITQGEQVSSIWKPIFKNFDIVINFGWKSFQWKSESENQAGVVCVIIGFSHISSERKIKHLFSDGATIQADYINAYLHNAPLFFVDNRSTPISPSTKILLTGNRPADGGHLIIDEKDYDEFIHREPQAINYIKYLVGSDELINNKIRYCLWLVNTTPAILKSMPAVMERLRLCREDRLLGASDRQKLADTPHLFRETYNPEHYIAIPYVSSDIRRYIPLSYLDSETIPTDLLKFIPNASLYDFGILHSNVHMAWVRFVSGRLGNGYRYSIKVVYNNFPWPTPTKEQEKEISRTAQAILDARALYPDSSLADLYDTVLMPKELLQAHRANDAAVMRAYGFSLSMTEEDCVAALMKLYTELLQA